LRNASLTFLSPADLKLADIVLN